MTKNHVTGLLVPPAEAKALAAAIQLLLGDPLLRKNMGQVASIYAKENFGFEGHAAQMRKLIDEIVVPEMQ